MQVGPKQTRLKRVPCRRITGSNPVAGIAMKCIKCGKQIDYVDTNDIEDLSEDEDILCVECGREERRS